jgi:exodeoxyribonuclease-3
MAFLEHLLEHLAALVETGRDLVVCGDFNIAHREVDLKNWRSNRDQSGFLPEERAWVDRLLERGLRDAYRDLVGPDAAHYSWWSSRGRARENDVGWRLDYHFTTPGLAARAREPRIYRERFFSDHAPVTIEYDP